MSYTVLTPAYYDAVIAGALGGMLQGQSGTQTGETAYNGVINAALALAQEIDTKIGAVTPTVAKANVLNELAGAWMAGRNPSGNPVASQLPATYNGAAAAIVSCWTAAITFLA